MEIKRFMVVVLLILVVLLITMSSVSSAQSGVSTDVVSKVVNIFYEKSSSWSSALEKYALNLFGICTTITIAMFGVKAVVHRNNLNEVLGQFIMTILFCSLILAVIHNYKEWSWNLINGLKDIASGLGPASANADKPLVTGYNLAKTIIDKIALFSNPIDTLGYIISALIVIITFALMTAQVVLIKCEASLVMNASMILLGLGGLVYFKEYAINVMRYVLSVAFKLFVMQLVMGLGLEFIEDMSLADAKLEDIIIVIGVSIVLFALVKSLPDAIAGIINGSNVSSGSALSQAAAAVAGGAVGAAATALGVSVGGSMAVKKSAQTAQASGASGVGGKAMQFGKALLGSHQEARHEAGKVGHFGRMSANAGKRLQEMKMRNMANDSNKEGDGNA